MTKSGARLLNATRVGVASYVFALPQRAPTRNVALPPNFSGRISVGNGSGRRPIVPVINGIDAAHRLLPSLFFDYVRDKSGGARDHEYPVERRGIHSQVGENGADRAV